MMTTAGAQVPEAFVRALRSLRRPRLRPGLELEEVPAPVRVAPFAAALAGTLSRVGRPDDELADGRFIVLHDPEGREDWQGDFRVVTLVRAEIEPDLSTDGLLGDVAWSWLVESLAERVGEVVALGGTVTRSINQSFGALDEQPDTVELEIRASWTPTSPELTTHLHAWADLLASAAGQPHHLEGVTSLDERR